MEPLTPEQLRSLRTVEAGRLPELVFWTPLIGDSQ